MKENFPYIMGHILEFEGGYVNDPNDPGGETNYGISKRSFPNEDIKNMTPARAMEIYREKYWNAIDGDNIPVHLDFCTMNCAVNAGVGTALQILKMSPDPDSYLFHQEEYYITIAGQHPALKKYLFGWFKRTVQLRRLIWGR